MRGQRATAKARPRLKGVYREDSNKRIPPTVGCVRLSRCRARSAVSLAPASGPEPTATLRSDLIHIATAKTPELHTGRAPSVHTGVAPARASCASCAPLPLSCGLRAAGCIRRVVDTQ
eukprot:scaffold41757_cov60-Phaeocystis_antarctica.AAC.1